MLAVMLVLTLMLLVFIFWLFALVYTLLLDAFKCFCACRQAYNTVDCAIKTYYLALNCFNCRPITCVCTVVCLGGYNIRLLSL